MSLRNHELRGIKPLTAAGDSDWLGGSVPTAKAFQPESQKRETF